MPATPIHNIYYAAGNDIASLNQITATMASSVENSLNSLQGDYPVLTFKWATSAERVAQAGMTAGDIGVELDTLTWYVFDGANWKLFLPTPYSIVLGRDAAADTIPSSGWKKLTTAGAWTTLSASNLVWDNGVQIAESGWYQISLNITLTNSTGLIGILLEDTTPNASTNIFGMNGIVVAQSLGVGSTTILRYLTPVNKIVPIAIAGTGTPAWSTTPNGSQFSIHKVA